MHKISIIGTGYIGLVTGACLADLGNNVICADIDENKIDNLNKGIIPIYEPGLEELVIKNLHNGTLQFTTDVQNAIQNSEIIFIAVNTPVGQNGQADISAIEAVSKVIGNSLNNSKIIVIRSTVPIGTHKIVQEIISASNQIENSKIEIVSMPEFLREGFAINDFMNPDRIIIGTKSKEIFIKLKEIFSKTNCDPKNIIQTTHEAAQTIKYVSNSFLALKVSFINEIANFCDQMEVDVFEVIHGIGLDKRIGQQFLKPGPGFGGSCFPKDLIALDQMAQSSNIILKSVTTTLEINESQKQLVIQKLEKLIGNFENKTITILGLAFKSNTDDIRKSPAIDIIKNLQNKNQNIKIQAYDPKAMQNFKKEIIDIDYFDNAYDACQNSDVILILTEWQEFTELDFEKISKIVKQKIVLDMRNILDLDKLKSLNFTIETIGRNVLAKNYLVGSFRTTSKWGFKSS